MECRDLPPGHAIPQAAADGGERCRALVMGEADGRRCRGVGHQTATLRRNPQRAIFRAVTSLTIHDIVISP